MQHSTLFLALKEAFLELSAAQPGFFRYPGRGNWFGDGARWRGDAGIEPELSQFSDPGFSRLLLWCRGLCGVGR